MTIFSRRNWICALWIILSGFLYADPLQVEVAGEAAILMNAETGAILFEKNPHTLYYPASTTKVATALYALKMKGHELDVPVVADQESLTVTTEEAKRKSHYTVPAYWLESDGSQIGIKVGEEFAFKDVLGGMLICSGNDAANVVAQHVGGSIPQFMEDLNAFIKELGCQYTTFYNPHGLHHPQHQTTAYDLALITREALKYPAFCEIVSKPKFVRPKTNKHKATTLLQTNRLLRPGKLYYSKAIGVKTGYHSKAKHTFIGAARFNGRTLIAVLLSYSNRQQLFKDAIKLFDTAFNQPKIHHVLLKAGKQNFSQTLAYANQPLQTHLIEDLSLDYYLAEDPKAKCLLYWDSLNLPIQKDQKVGELQLISAEGKLLKKASLLAFETVSFKWPYSWLHYLSDSPVLLGFLLLLAVLVFAITSF